MWFPPFILRGNVTSLLNCWDPWDCVVCLALTHEWLVNIFKGVSFKLGHLYFYVSPCSYCRHPPKKRILIIFFTTAPGECHISSLYLIWNWIHGVAISFGLSPLPPFPSEDIVFAFLLQGWAGVFLIGRQLCSLHEHQTCSCKWGDEPICMTWFIRLLGNACIYQLRKPAKQLVSKLSNITFWQRNI